MIFVNNKNCGAAFYIYFTKNNNKEAKGQQDTGKNKNKRGRIGSNKSVKFVTNHGFNLD